MKRRRVLDSFALLAYLKKENGCEKVKSLLSSEQVDVLMNDVNIGETFYIVARERGFEKADYFLNIILPTLPILPLPNSLGQAIDAARIKAAHPISYADAFAVATAIRERASIVTGDPDFKHVEKHVKIDWL